MRTDYACGKADTEIESHPWKGLKPSIVGSSLDVLAQKVEIAEVIPGRD